MEAAEEIQIYFYKFAIGGRHIEIYEIIGNKSVPPFVQAVQTDCHFSHLTLSQVLGIIAHVRGKENSVFGVGRVRRKPGQKCG